jgi:hypothetical protein
MNHTGHWYGTERERKTGQLLKGNKYIYTGVKAGHWMHMGEEYLNLF